MRVQGWEKRLAEDLHESQARPFAWGTRDCALWAAFWVRDCTGEDFTGDWLGRYSTGRGARVRMARLGFKDVGAIADAHLTPKPVTLARRGDLVLHPVTSSLGVCEGVKSHFLTPSGVTTVPTLSCAAAWGVG
jgi:hypothetical protein